MNLGSISISVERERIKLSGKLLCHWGTDGEILFLEGVFTHLILTKKKKKAEKFIGLNIWYVYSEVLHAAHYAIKCPINICGWYVNPLGNTFNNRSAFHLQGWSISMSAIIESYFWSDQLFQFTSDFASFSPESFIPRILSQARITGDPALDLYARYISPKLFF